MEATEKLPNRPIVELEELDIFYMASVVSWALPQTHKPNETKHKMATHTIPNPDYNQEDVKQRRGKGKDQNQKKSSYFSARENESLKLS